MPNCEKKDSLNQRIQFCHKFITYEEAKERYSLGETTLRQMAKDCGALYKIGKAARINMDIMDSYLESFRSGI